MRTPIPKQVLFDYWAGNSTQLQRKLIEEWLSDPANHEAYYRWLDEWEAGQPQFLPDADAALDRVLATLDQPAPTAPAEPAAPTPVLPLRNRYPLWAVAATITLVLGLLGWAFRRPLLYSTYETAYGETRSWTLADGSRVTLNANSALQVPRFGWLTSQREVWLRGEGEFDVVHTRDHRPFRVRTAQQLTVEVLGTEFVVLARPRAQKVVLNRGQVRVAYQARQPLLMKPGDIVEVKPGGRLEKQFTPQPQRYSAWKDHRFYFDQTSLQEIAGLVQEQFGVTVTVDSALAGRRIAGTFQARQADDLLQALAALLNAELQPGPDNARHLAVRSL